MQMRKHVTNVSACYMNITRLSLFMILEGHPIHEGTLGTRLMLTTPTQCKLLSSLHTVWWLGRCLSYVLGYMELFRLWGTVPWYFCAVNARLACSTHEAYSGLCSFTKLHPQEVLATNTNSMATEHTIFRGWLYSLLGGRSTMRCTCDVSV